VKELGLLDDLLASAISIHQESGRKWCINAVETLTLWIRVSAGGSWWKQHEQELRCAVNKLFLPKNTIKVLNCIQFHVCVMDFIMTRSTIIFLKRDLADKKDIISRQIIFLPIHLAKRAPGDR
jgi:hypothetical protein